MGSIECSATIPSGGEGSFVCRAFFPGFEEVYESAETRVRTERDAVRLTVSPPGKYREFRGLSLVLLKRTKGSVASWEPYGRTRILHVPRGESEHWLREENGSETPSAKLLIKNDGAFLRTKTEGSLAYGWFFVPVSFAHLPKLVGETEGWFETVGDSSSKGRYERFSKGTAAAATFAAKKKVSVSRKFEEADQKFVQRTHMPYWNNKKASPEHLTLPGWFFAVEAPSRNRFDVREFEEVFCKAKLLLHFTGFTGAEQSAAARLALGMTVFGGSIRYASDVAPFSGKGVERFSSLGRNDGQGDCEDIAKESCMCFREFKNLREEEVPVSIVDLWKESQKYIPVVLLVTVRTFKEKKRFAHAVCGLLPASFLRSPPSKRQSRGELLLCDGTYLCYPRFACEGKGWKRPYEYRHVVSAMTCEPVEQDDGHVREIYFSYAEEKEDSYGVWLEDLCLRPELVTWRGTHSPVSAETMRGIEDILTANRPIASTTTRSEWSVTERFTLLQRNRLEELIGFSFPIVYPRESQRDNMQRLNEGYREYAGYYDEKTKEYVFTHQGTRASVPRHFLKREGGGAGQITWHNHHLNEGNMRDQAFNPPSHHDVIIFLAMRATAKAFDDFASRTKLEIISGKNNVYEMVEAPYHDAPVDFVEKIDTFIGSMKRARGFQDEASAYARAHEKLRELLTSPDFWKKMKETYQIDENCANWEDWIKKTHVEPKRMFYDEQACDAYLRAFESVGVTIVRHSKKRREEIIRVITR